MRQLLISLVIILLLCSCSVDKVETVELYNISPITEHYTFTPTLENVIENSTHIAVVRLEAVESGGVRSLMTFSVVSQLAGDNIPDKIKVIGFTDFYLLDETYLLFFSLSSIPEWPYDVYTPFDLFTFRISDEEKIECLQGLEDPKKNTARKYIPPFVKDKHNRLSFLVDYIQERANSVQSVQRVLDYADTEFLTRESDLIIEVTPTETWPVNLFVDSVDFEITACYVGSEPDVNQLLLPNKLQIGESYILCLNESDGYCLMTRNSVFPSDSPEYKDMRIRYVGATPDQILQGYSLDELGLEIDLDALRVFPDPNWNHYEIYYLVWHSSAPLMDNYNNKAKCYGNVSVLGYDYPDEIAYTWIDVLFIQGFLKPLQPEGEHFIMVDSKIYTLEEMKQYLIYEDDSHIVYDITDLSAADNFFDVIQILSESKGYSFEWMIEVNDYLKSYEGIVIRTKY